MSLLVRMGKLSSNLKLCTVNSAFKAEKAYISTEINSLSESVTNNTFTLSPVMVSEYNLRWKIHLPVWIIFALTCPDGQFLFVNI